MKTKVGMHGNRSRQAPAFNLRLVPVLATAFLVQAALANPVGPQVVNGQASFSHHRSTLSITNSPGAIINWNSFSIDAGEITRFIQKDTGSAVLNRITGQDPSRILGALQSNGRVFLVNPNGILFGAGAQVDVNGLVASTLNISNEDFINGRLNFKAGERAGNLENKAAITTPDGGQVVLIAPNVENSGIITSPRGDVMLAAGHTVQLADSRNPDLQVVLSAPENQALNLGQVISAGGRTGIYGALVRQRGIVNADSAVVDEAGRIVFKSSRETLLEGGSQTTARGAGKGGEIQILGEWAGMFDQARIDASGKSGGGTVLIGGDFQGKNPLVSNASRTYIGKEAQINANALDQGDGGKVIVWSDEATRFYGSISARGGSQGGSGGFAEVSGKQFLDFKGRADLAAPMGDAGTLLLDPGSVEISSADTTTAGAGGAFTGGTGTSVVNNTDVMNLLNGGTNVTITSDGSVTASAPVTWTTPKDLTLSAGTDIILNAAINGASGSLFLTGLQGTVTQNSSGKITASRLAVKSAGSVTLNGTSNEVGKIAAQLTGANSNFLFKNTGNLIVGAGINGVSGISTNVSGNYVQGAPDGIIALQTGGSLTQESTALLGGKAVYLEGTSVSLTEANPTGVLSGKAGPGSTDTFSYRSANGILVTKIAPFSTFATSVSGVQAGGTAGQLAIQLQGGDDGISQDSLAPITATGGLKLVTSGPVSLASASNSISALTGTSLGSLSFFNATSMVAGLAEEGISTAGGGSISLATGADVESLLTVDQPIDAGTGRVELGTDKLVLNSTVKAQDFASIRTATAGRPVTIGSLTCASTPTPCLGLVDLHRIDTPTLGIGGHSSSSVAAGNIHVAAVTRSGGTVPPLTDIHANTLRLGLLSGGGVTQGGAIDVLDLGIEAGASVVLDATNSVSRFAAKLSAGSLSFTNGKTFDVASLSGGTGTHAYSISGITTNNADVTLTLDGTNLQELKIPGQIQAGTGTVSLTSSGSVYGSGTSPDISAGILKIVANGTGGISGEAGLHTTVPRIETLHAPAGSIDILSLAGTVLGTESPSSAVAVSANNTTGTISIKTASPHPITVHGDITAGGNIQMTAGAAGSAHANNVITIKRPVTSANGTITLAGNAVTGSMVPTGANVILQTYVAPPPSSPPAPPTVDECVADPSRSGCGAVLPTLDQCTSTPTTIGCSVVLPTMEQCVSFPGTAGCSAVLPSLNLCTTAPGTPGCAAVLPTLGQCTSAPSTAGCSAVLPLLSQCVASPSTAGCSVVLPLLSQCVASPSTAGCSAVLPPLSQCTTTPSTTGCSAVLPTLAQCTNSPAVPGCAVVLPTLSHCTASPTSAGCNAVLPSAAACTTAPSLAGCSVVPTITSCTATPALAGCSAVLPALSACVASPSLAGCSVVLPTLGQCAATPALAGCAAVVPRAASCTVNSAANGCSALSPVQQASQRTMQVTMSSTASTVIAHVSSGDVARVRPQAGRANGASDNGTSDGKEGTNGRKTAAGPEDTGVQKNESVKKLYCN